MWVIYASVLAAALTVASAEITSFNGLWNDPHIVNGEVAEPGQFPYQAALFTDFNSFCGGSVISNRWVLTAAHCTLRSRWFTLFIGAYNILLPHENGRQVHLARQGIVHAEYSPSRIMNDIAVIQTLSPIHFTATISSVLLPDARLLEESFTKKIAVISGWGLVSEESKFLSPVLRTASVTVISEDECKEKFASSDPYLELGPTTLCGIGANKKSGCQGDSGGPLVIQIDGKAVQIGIVSSGSIKGCDLGHPHVYTRLTKYMSWVKNTTGI